MAQLFVLSGPDVGKSFELENGDSLGRSPDCVVTLRDASISRRHAHIERNGPQWFIVDDGSRNGIAVDGQKHKRVELHDMQEFKVGEILVRFRASAPQAQAAPPIEAPAPHKPVEPVKPATPPVEPTETADEDELVLGGGDDELELDFKNEPPRRPVAPPPPPRAPIPEVAATRFATRPPPSPVMPSVVDTGFGPARGAGDTISRRKAGAGDRVLQYNKVENQRGFAGTDIAQFPLWMRLGAYLLALIVAAAIAYVAFFGTAKLKSMFGGASDAAPVDVPADEPAQDGH
jgi:predicted component of type VI protein secretion system